MTAGIVGLGLIGGSFAKAYQAAGHRVLVFDRDDSIRDFALLSGAAEGVLEAPALAGCDLILLAVPPAAAVDYLRRCAPRFGPGPLVMDCCGVKERLCAAAFPLAREHGFSFIGGHPMAGSHRSGFRYARGDLFRGAPMVLVPEDRRDIALLSRAKELLAPAGFGSFSVASPRAHDELIAFTSQLAHVVSSAYIKSPTALRHRGFSAGSYRDMTRVAWLDAEMWAALFLENRDFLLREIRGVSRRLEAYAAALEQEDLPGLTALLEEGRRRKEEVDGP